MLQLNIAAMLALKGIDKPYAWLCKQKISHRIAQKLLNGEQKLIPIRVINIICTAAYCTPSDLFVWQPDAKIIVEASHPLQKLRSKPTSKLSDKLKKLTTEQIAELERLADEMGDGELKNNFVK